MDLEPLYKRAIEHYKEFESATEIVKNSIPVLYFGDIKAYEGSKLKVVTVGLNPSYHEFDEGKYRFGHYDRGSFDSNALERALSGYFRGKNPLDWFDRAYETLLQPLGASFYGKHHPRKPAAGWCSQKNIALHTDIGTPLATNKTWSALSPGVKVRLQSAGFPLWRDLMQQLEPDLILISVGKRHLSRLGDNLVVCVKQNADYQARAWHA